MVIKYINKKRYDNNSSKNITFFKIKAMIIFVGFFIINYIKLFNLKIIIYSYNYYYLKRFYNKYSNIGTLKRVYRLYIPLYY